MIDPTALPEVEPAQDQVQVTEDRRESVEQSPSRRKIVKSDISIVKSATPTLPNPANSFKARPVPVYPTQQPRMTKTTALRLGLELPSSSNTTTSRSRQSSQEDSTSPSSSNKRGAVITTAERAQAFGADHRRRDSAPIVASTARPRVEVRLTKAAALRTGVEWPKKERMSGVAVGGGIEGKRPSSVGGQSVASQRGSIGVASPKSDVGGPVRPKPIQRQQSSTFSVTSQGSQTTSNATRRSSVVNSTRPPKIEPRMDRTTKLRLGLEVDAKRIRTDTPVDFDGGQSSVAR